MRGRAGWLCVLGLATWGCGPPQVVPMLPPGYVAPPAATPESGGMEAEGEVRSRGVMPQSANTQVQPSAAAPGPVHQGAQKRD